MSWRFESPWSVSPARKLLSDLALKLDAVRAVRDHALSSFESPGSNLKLPLSGPRGPLHLLEAVE